MQTVTFIFVVKPMHLFLNKCILMGPENNPGYLVTQVSTDGLLQHLHFAETKGPFRNGGICWWVEQMWTERPPCSHLGVFKQMPNITIEAMGNVIEDGIGFMFLPRRLLQPPGRPSSNNRSIILPEVWRSCFLSAKSRVLATTDRSDEFWKNSTLPPLVQYVLLVLSSLLLICTLRF